MERLFLKNHSRRKKEKFKFFYFYSVSLDKHRAIEINRERIRRPTRDALGPVTGLRDNSGRI